ncbi:MAG: hypothetical protein Q4A00_03480 [Flavobacteriaceae bacterium]|nr:hypothetical protein [Flavobacteriaceae bacterium]
MILKKDILEQAFKNYKEQNENISFQDFPKMVAEGMRMLKENYESTRTRFFYLIQ